ncbi:MAG: T9SS type A sorting domain-containing protein [Bacteroidota bacterium]
MKTIKNVLISFILSVLFINPAVAGNDVPVIKVVDKKLNLSMENSSVQTTVKLLDSAGSALIEEQVVAYKQFASTYNLESLTPGQYTLVIESNQQKTTQPITITAQEVQVNEQERADYYPAQFEFKRGQLKLSMLNPTKNSVQIFVFDQMGRKKHQETITNEAVIERSLNMKKFKKGNYTVVINNGDQQFTKSIKR